jgi:hypothetical protein
VDVLDIDDDLRFTFELFFFHLVTHSAWGIAYSEMINGL